MSKVPAAHYGGEDPANKRRAAECSCGICGAFNDLTLIRREGRFRCREECDTHWLVPPKVYT